MLERIEGLVKSYRALSTRSVQIELNEINGIIELTASEPWVINRGDHVSVSGEYDSFSGKFYAYAYKNHSKGVFGMLDASGYFGYGFGLSFIAGSILFCWAIFPLFTHLPEGIRSIKETKQSKRFHKKVIKGSLSVCVV